jgi:hypothetical protein
MHEVSKGKDESKQCCAARGFATLQEWRKANRRAVAEFRSRMSKRGEDKTRLRRLIATLDSEFRIYLEMWTS